MAALTILLIAGVLIAAVLLYPSWRNRRILRRPFPAEWERILQRRLPVFPRLSPDERGQLRGLVQLFIAGKRYYGCGGLVIDDDIRVTIAAGACLLLLNRNTAVFPKLRHILVYPSAFVAEHEARAADGTVGHGFTGLLGESWDSGKVILSWDDVEFGVADFTDGHNVLLHEFSHQLDSESGFTDGAPVLHSNSYRTWSRILAEEFRALGESLDHGREPLLDEYGASDPAEFFAVATETFFERPHQMAARHPALFNELKTYYRSDPRRWHKGS